jgi:hypothetical protein
MIILAAQGCFIFKQLRYVVSFSHLLRSHDNFSSAVRRFEYEEFREKKIKVQAFEELNPIQIEQRNSDSCVYSLLL